MLSSKALREALLIGDTAASKGVRYAKALLIFMDSSDESQDETETVVGVERDVENVEEDSNEDQEASHSQSRPPPTSNPLSEGLAHTIPTIRPEALRASVYDIVPTIAAPHSTSINAVTSTPDLRWVFSGGSDGYIRKFNWIETANGKSMLTVAQRHPFVDSVTKAGVLVSYWENNEQSNGRISCVMYILRICRY